MARQGVWGDLKIKLLALWGGMSVTQLAPAISDTDFQSGYGVAEVSEPVRTKLDVESGENARAVETMASDPGEAQRAPEATVADEFAIVLPPEDELPASGKSANPTELPAQDDGHQPLEETALPEKDQVLFVVFAFDSVDLPPASRETLNQVVKAMSQSRSSVASITGFSDNQGEEAYNLELSRQRANAVEQYLVSKGVEQERLRVEGRGAIYDVADAEISAAGLESEEYRIVKIRISSGPGSTDIYK